jgi:hypothetical protein
MDEYRKRMMEVKRKRRNAWGFNQAEAKRQGFKIRTNDGQ